jgi:hypothetical protein
MSVTTLSIHFDRNRLSLSFARMSPTLTVLSVWFVIIGIIDNSRNSFGDTQLTRRHNYVIEFRLSIGN